MERKKFWFERIIRNNEKKRYETYGRKLWTDMKKYGRKESWIVIRFGKYGIKVSWNVKWYGKYGRKVFFLQNN